MSIILSSVGTYMIYPRLCIQCDYPRLCIHQDDIWRHECKTKMLITQKSLQDLLYCFYETILDDFLRLWINWWCMTFVLALLCNCVDNDINVNHNVKLSLKCYYYKESLHRTFKVLTKLTDSCHRQRFIWLPLFRQSIVDYPMIRRRMDAVSNTSLGAEWSPGFN